MPNVQYQFRNIGLNLPPDLGAWLDAYRANRLPIAMEEWKLKVEQAIADGKVDPKYRSELLALMGNYQKVAGDIAGKELYLAGINTQSGAGVSKEEIKARASMYGADVRAAIENLKQASIDRRQSREFRNDLHASMIITPSESEAINGLTSQALSVYEAGIQRGDDPNDAIRNAVSIAANAAMAAAAEAGAKNVVHGTTYLDEAAKRLMAGLHATPDQMPLVKAAVQEFFYESPGVPYELDESGNPSAAAAFRSDKDLAPVMREADATVPSAGASEKPIPDMEQYNRPAPEPPAAPAAQPGAAAPPPPTGMVVAPATQPTPAASSVPASTSGGGQGSPPPMQTVFKAPGGVPIPSGVDTATYGTAVGARATGQAQSIADWAREQYMKDEERVAAYKAKYGAEIPPFRLAPQPQRHPEQDDIDAQRARFAYLRENNPEKYQQAVAVLSEIRRSKAPDANIKRDLQPTLADKVMGENEWSRGPGDNNPSSHAASAARTASQEWATLQAAIKKGGMEGSPEAQAKVNEWLQKNTAVLAALPKEARPAYMDNLALDAGTQERFRTLVRARIQADYQAKAELDKAAAFPSVSGEHDPEQEAAFDKAMTPFKPEPDADRKDKAVRSVYNALKTMGPDSVKQAIALAKSDDAFGGLEYASALQKMWDADEDPGMHLATGKAAKALGIDKGAAPSAGTPTNIAPPLPGGLSGGATRPNVVTTGDVGKVGGSLEVRGGAPPAATSLGGRSSTDTDVSAVGVVAPAPGGPSSSPIDREYEAHPRFSTLVDVWKENNPKSDDLTDEAYEVYARKFARDAIDKSSKKGGK